MSGFTLVELIIAIAIMAVLAGAISLTVIRYIRKARASNAMEELRTIVSAVETGMVPSYAEDHEMNLDKTYTDDEGNAQRCGVLTNYMISRAQNKKCKWHYRCKCVGVLFCTKGVGRIECGEWKRLSFPEFYGRRG